PNTEQTPDYRGATARAPTSEHHGGGLRLDLGTPATRGSKQHRFGSQHPDSGPCGTLAHGAGLGCSVRYTPPGAGGQQATRQATIASPQGHSGQRQQARGHGYVLLAESGFRRVRVPCATVAVYYNTATDQAGPEQALASRPPADI